MKAHLVPLLVIPLLGLGACRKGNSGRVEAEAISACEQGVTRATQSQDFAEAAKIYYTACAGVHAEERCQAAWKKAATAKRDDQMKIILRECGEAYCSDLGGDKFEACRDDFKVTPSSIQRAWPALHGAILARDTGPYQARVQSALLIFYLHATRLASPEPPPAPSASAAPPGDGAASPPGSASATPPGSARAPAGGSAAPAASGAPVPSAARPANQPAAASKAAASAAAPTASAKK